MVWRGFCGGFSEPGRSLVQLFTTPLTIQGHGILQARILEWVAFCFSRGSSQPRIEPKSPTLQADSLPAEPQGKPKDTGVGSLSLLQGIFPTKELNWGLLHCILLSCLFNLYAEYIMRNTGLEETQAGIKTARRNINSLRYADDTTLMAESEE